MLLSKIYDTLYADVYYYKYVLCFENQKLKFSDYPTLNDLGIWTLKQGKKWAIIPKDQTTTPEAFKETIQEIIPHAELTIKVERAPIDY